MGGEGRGGCCYYLVRKSRRGIIALQYKKEAASNSHRLLQV